MPYPPDMALAPGSGYPQGLAVTEDCWLPQMARAYRKGLSCLILQGEFIQQNKGSHTRLASIDERTDITGL